MGYNTETIRYPSANGSSMVSAELFLPVDTDPGDCADFARNV